jgi:flagellar biogenesis protein FliO
MNNYTQELLFTLMALILVIALAWLLLKALKGFHIKQSGANRINLLLTLPVGSRERVVVVSYREYEYLVGIIAGGMTLLDKRPDQQDSDSVADNNTEEQ